MTVHAPGFIEIVAARDLRHRDPCTRFPRIISSISPRLHPEHAGFWHLLGEVEVVFGFWAMVLLVLMASISAPGMRSPISKAAASPNRPSCSSSWSSPRAVRFSTLPARPCACRAVAAAAGGNRLLLYGAFGRTLLGSFITEPAAMTLTALLLREQFFGRNAPVQVHVRHARRAVRQHLDRRRDDEFRRTAGGDGGGTLGLDFAS